MDRLVMVAVLLACAGEAAAQDRTPRQDAGSRSHFGAPVLEGTTLRDQGVVTLGGRGGLNLTPSLAVGIGLYATVTAADAPEGAVPEVPGLFDIKMERFGMEVEYAVHPADPTHLTVRSFVGGGAAHYVKDGTREQEGETDFLFLLEPAVGVERRVSDGVHLNLSVSYRLARGVELHGLTTGDLGGPAAALAVKLGRF